MPYQIVEVGGIVIKNKIYDGSNTAVVDTTNAMFVYNGESVYFSANDISLNIVATFESTGVAQGIPVTVSSISISGVNAADFIAPMEIVGLGGNIILPTGTDTICHFVGYVHDRFIMSGYDDISGNVLMCKNKTWSEPRTLRKISITSVSYNSATNVGVAVGYGGETNIYTIISTASGSKNLWPAYHRDGYPLFGDDGYIAGVCCDANGIFMAVGGSSNNTTKIVLSANGKRWRNVSNNPFGDGYGQAICYASDIDKFVAVGSGSGEEASDIYYSQKDSMGRISFSPVLDDKNGVATPLTNNVFSAVCYGMGKFVAVGESGIWYSSNGSVWTQVTSVAGPVTSVCYGMDYFVAIGGGSIWYSSDGSVWTQVTIEMGSFASVCYGDNKFVAVGNVIYYSGNGKDWSKANAYSTVPQFSIQYFSSVSYGTTGLGIPTFVAVAGDIPANIYYSRNGGSLWAKMVPTPVPVPSIGNQAEVLG